jgi:uncharacterized protein (DUF885 family)
MLRSRAISLIMGEARAEEVHAMKRFTHVVPVVLIVFAAAAAFSCYMLPRSKSGQKAPLSAVAARELRQIITSSVSEAMFNYPHVATRSGLHVYKTPSGESVNLDRELPNFSDEVVEARVETLNGYLKRLDEKVPENVLSLQDKADRRMLADAIRLELFELHDLRAHATNPLFHMSALAEALYYPTVVAYAPEDVRLADVLGRMDLVPAYVERMTRMLEQSSAAQTDAAADVTDSLIAFVRDTLPARMEGKKDLVASFDGMKAPVLDALGKLKTYLEGDFRKKSTRTWRLGQERYDTRFAIAYHEIAAPTEVVDMAKKRIEALRKEMYDLAKPAYCERNETDRAVCGATKAEIKAEEERKAREEERKAAEEERKVRDEEARAAEEARRAEAEDKRKAAEESRQAEAEKRKAEQDKAKAEREQKKAEEAAKKAEEVAKAAAAKAEEAAKAAAAKAEEAAKKAEEAAKKADGELKKAEDEKKKADEELKKTEDEKKKAEEQKKADDKKKAEDEKKKAEEQKKADDKKKAEDGDKPKKEEKSGPDNPYGLLLHSDTAALGAKADDKPAAKAVPPKAAKPEAAKPEAAKPEAAKTKVAKTKATDKAPAEASVPAAEKQVKQDAIARVIEFALRAAQGERTPRSDLVAKLKSSVDAAADQAGMRGLVRDNSTGNLEVAPMPAFASPRGLDVLLVPPPPLQPRLNGFLFAAVPGEGPSGDERLGRFASRSLPLLAARYAVPGEYTQMRYANALQEDTRRAVRVLYGDPACEEGWGLYAALAFDDAGGEEAGWEQELLAMAEVLQAAALAVVDVGLHRDEMSEKDAMAVLVDDAFMTEAEAESALEAVRLAPTELSAAFIGLDRWQRLRADAKAKLGGAFKVKEFHEKALGFGPVPLSSLELLVFAESLEEAPPAAEEGKDTAEADAGPTTFSIVDALTQ